MLQREERRDLVQQVCEYKIKLFSIIFFVFFVFSFSGEAKKKKLKVLPSYLQKAYVIQKNAIVYTRASFDSVQITNIPAGTVVTISKKIYRPKNRFGTFYRIYISKPKKIKAYISEIDVVPRYVRSGSKFKANPSFDQVKKKLKYVKDFQFNAEPEADMDFSDTPLSQMRFIGMAVSYSWLAYESEPSFFPSWFFGLRLSGKGLPISNVITDMSLMFSFSPPVIGGDVLKNGYILKGDFLFKLPLFEAPFFSFQLGAGVMAKLKGALAPSDPALSEVGAGVAGSASLILKMNDRFSFLMEGKGYYDLSEQGVVPVLIGGLLVAF